MTKLHAALATLAVGAMFVAACGDDAAPTTNTTDTADGDPDVTLPAPDDAADPVDTVDGAWVLTSGTVDGVDLVLLGDRQVTLVVEWGEVGGTAACNGYGGFADVADNALTIGELSWTEMGCEPAVMDLEQAYLAALSDTTSYEITDGALTLAGPSSELVFAPEALVDDQAIVGTSWVLDTVIDGDAATNSAMMGLATLTLHDDGTLSGSTNCRVLQGEWIASGTEIVFTSFSAIDNPNVGVCAPESQTLDGFIIGVLEGGFSVEVEGSRMTLMASGGEGLSYTAG